MDAQDEKAIVEKCKVDQKYFGQLFDAHYHNILRYCIRRTGELSLKERI
jgi:DNA-directed RNA polymerase specialized sigma24 family protein